MKTSELRAKSRGELSTELAATQKELFNLQMQKNMGGTTGNAVRSHNFKEARRKIARIKTILNEKTRESHERKN